MYVSLFGNTVDEKPLTLLQPREGFPMNLFWLSRKKHILSLPSNLSYKTRLMG